MRKVEVNILVGLPGSGKSTYAFRPAKNSGNDYAAVLDVDGAMRELYRLYHRTPSISHSIVYAIAAFNMDPEKPRPLSVSQCDKIYVDGLFLKHEEIVEAASYFAQADYFRSYTVVIHQWNEDRDTCVKNDEGRRDETSIGLIRSAEYHEVDLQRLQDDLKKYRGVTVHPEIIHHVVELKPSWQREHGDVISPDGILRSSKYLTGGAAGNCWNDEMSCVEGEEIKLFTELYDFLADAFPDLKLSDWRKIEPEVVSQENWQTEEYYGGFSNYIQWVCDINKLYMLMEAHGYNV